MSKRDPKRAIFDHKKFSLLFFPALNKDLVMVLVFLAYLYLLPRKIREEQNRAHFRDKCPTTTPTAASLEEMECDDTCSMIPAAEGTHEQSRGKKLGMKRKTNKGMDENRMCLISWKGMAK